MPTFNDMTIMYNYHKIINKLINEIFYELTDDICIDIRIFNKSINDRNQSILGLSVFFIYINLSFFNSLHFYIIMLDLFM